jgi:hypothetical protein
MSVKTQKVVGDLGSQEVAQLINSYNKLLDILDTLIVGMSTAADTAAVNALSVTAVASLATVYKIQPEPAIALSPAPTPV